MLGEVCLCPSVCRAAPVAVNGPRRHNEQRGHCYGHHVSEAFSLRICGHASTFHQRLIYAEETSPQRPTLLIWSVYAPSGAFYADGLRAGVNHFTAAAGNGIFVVGDRRPKTCLRDETYAQRRKCRPHNREKPAENRLFRRQVFHGEFRWTGWWAHQGSNLGDDPFPRVASHCSDRGSSHAHYCGSEGARDGSSQEPNPHRFEGERKGKCYQGHGRAGAGPQRPP